MGYKVVLDGLFAIKVYPFAFEGENLYYRDFSVNAGDECYAHLQSCLDKDGKIKTDRESIKEFQAYRNKFVAYSLCDSTGKEIFSLEEIQKLDYLKVQSLFVALSDAKNGRKEAV